LSLANRLGKRRGHVAVQPRRPVHRREPAAPGAVGDVTTQEYPQEKYFERIDRRLKFGRSLTKSPHLGVHHRVEMRGEIARIRVHIMDPWRPDQTMSLDRHVKWAPIARSRPGLKHLSESYAEIADQAAFGSSAVSTATTRKDLEIAHNDGKRTIAVVPIR
jgi:hypothetical protein